MRSTRLPTRGNVHLLHVLQAHRFGSGRHLLRASDHVRSLIALMFAVFVVAMPNGLVLSNEFPSGSQPRSHILSGWTLRAWLRNWKLHSDARCFYACRFRPGSGLPAWFVACPLLWLWVWTTTSLTRSMNVICWLDPICYYTIYWHLLTFDWAPSCTNLLPMNRSLIGGGAGAPGSVHWRTQALELRLPVAIYRETQRGMTWHEQKMYMHHLLFSVLSVYNLFSQNNTCALLSKYFSEHSVF